MKNQNTEHRDQTKKKIVCILTSVICALIFTSHFLLPTSAAAAKWSGIDESVVEKYAEEHGRAPKEPFINTDQGDMLLFLFLIGGAVSGFAAGYYWRKLTEGPKRKEHSPQAGESQKST